MFGPRGNNSLGCGNIVGQRYRWILNDRDRVAVLPQDIIDTLPTISPLYMLSLIESRFRLRRSRVLLTASYSTVRPNSLVTTVATGVRAPFHCDEDNWMEAWS